LKRIAFELENGAFSASWIFEGGLGQKVLFDLDDKQNIGWAADDLI